MKKTYTKKQIQEAIAYWKNRLNEIESDSTAELMAMAKNLSPETARLAELAQQMQDESLDESTGKAVMAAIGALLVAVAVVKTTVKKAETPLEQAAAIIEGKAESKTLEEKYKILTQAIDQIGDITSGMAGDVIHKWGDGKISKADADLALGKLGRAKKNLKAKKAEVAQKLFDKIMAED